MRRTPTRLITVTPLESYLAQPTGILRSFLDIANFRCEVLLSKFPIIPAVTIHQTMAQQNFLYAPSFIALHNMHPSQYKAIKTPRGKKARVAIELQTPIGREVEEEMAWIEGWLERRARDAELERIKTMEQADEEAARALNFKLHEESGGLLEWYFTLLCADNSGCCFDECPANCMTSCADGHVFCLDCAKRNAESVVGSGG
jgi:TRIAD3 protein (E3 ubiquitin-protein ligase RNF216)